MKKSTIVITASMILVGLASNVYAAEILGYPIVAKQAKFYSIILGVMAASMAMVAVLLPMFLVGRSEEAGKGSQTRRESGFCRRTGGCRSISQITRVPGFHKKTPS